MKEIKFRAWHKKYKFVIHWPFIVHFFDEEIRATLPDRSKIEVFPMEDIDLMQFTGLKDSKGKEIYEGDVIQWLENTWDDEKDEPVKLKKVSQVCFGEGSVYRESGYVGGAFQGFYLADKKGSQQENMQGESIDLSSEESLEVIGNIWENRDLLNK